MSKGTMIEELAKELGICLDDEGGGRFATRYSHGQVTFEGDQLMYVLLLKRDLAYWRDAHKPRWIPCTERMPEPHTAVLVWNGKDVGIGWNNPDVPESDCTHWMPLPEGPE